MEENWQKAPFGTSGAGEVWLWNGEPEHILDSHRCYVENPKFKVKLVSLEEAEALGVSVL